MDCSESLSCSSETPALPAAAVALVAIAAACQEPEPLSLESRRYYRAQLDLDGASLGWRTATIEVTDANRRLVDAEHVVVSAIMTSMDDMSGASVVADEVGTGRYEAKGRVLHHARRGNTAVRIDGRGPRSDEQAVFTLDAVP